MNLYLPSVLHHLKVVISDAISEDWCLTVTVDYLSGTHFLCAPFAAKSLGGEHLPVFFKRELRLIEAN